jgi:hypothetical protein
MKKYLIMFLVIALLLIASFPCLAKWEEKDTALLVTELAQWSQDRYASRHTQDYTHEEMTVGLDENGNFAVLKDVIYVYEGFSNFNPLLGSKPDTKTVDTYHAASILLNYLIAKYGSDKWHNIWVWSKMTLNVGMIGNNYHLNIKCKF